jgi:N-acetylglutamate synthase-like GNAT family acetyltransferase
MIRRAVSGDSVDLTRIVRASSAYEGEYRRMVEHIVISPEQIARDLVYVYELKGHIVGFYSLMRKDSHAELDFLFVDTDLIAHGIGRKLFLHMLAEARQHGYNEVLIVSHPPAEAFYARMGAVTVAMQPPAGRVTWSRPRMVVRTRPAEEEVDCFERSKNSVE